MVEAGAGMEAVTVILVTDVTEPPRTEKDWLQKRMEAPLAGPVLAAMESVQNQDYGNVNLSVVRNVEEYPLADMQRVALQRCKDPYVAFMSDDEMWPAGWLSSYVTSFEQHPEWTHSTRPDGRIVFARRGAIGA